VAHRAYLKDVFERLPTLKNAELATLLPHHWRAPHPRVDLPYKVPLAGIDSFAVSSLPFAKKIRQ